MRNFDKFRQARCVKYQMVWSIDNEMKTHVQYPVSGIIKAQIDDYEIIMENSKAPYTVDI